jgi:hypothetical protein
VLSVESRDDDFDNDLWCWKIVGRNVSTAVKVMFVDRPTAGESVGADCQLERFENGRLACVVVAQKDGRAFKVYICGPNPTKFLNMNVDYIHRSRSRKKETARLFGSGSDDVSRIGRMNCSLCTNVHSWWDQ